MHAWQLSTQAAGGWVCGVDPPVRAVRLCVQEADDIDLVPEQGADADAAPAHSFSRTPAILLALDDLAHAQGGGAASASGDASKGASASSSGGDGDAGCYRLQQCFVHCSGALLLDPRDGDKYDRFLRCVGGPHCHWYATSPLCALRRACKPGTLEWGQRSAVMDCL